MLCDGCASAERSPLLLKVKQSLPRPADAAFACERCGRALVGSPAARVVDTLAQLARFGLTGEVLLARRRL